MQSRCIEKLYKILTYKISIKKLFISIAKVVFKPKVIAYNTVIDDDYNLQINELSSNFDKIKTNKIPSLILLWRDLNIKVSTCLNPNGKFFNVKIPKIIEVPPVFTMLKLKKSNLIILTLQRFYPINIFADLHSFKKDDITIKNKAIFNKIDENLIELDRRLRITEEIVEMIPYIKIENSQNLIKVPIIKQPLYKSYFTESQMDHFKDLLAKQSKLSKINIEIVSIYDKFSIENYDSIKQDSSSKNLICYLKNKSNELNEDKLYYLIIGKRRDNNAPLKAILKMKLVEEISS